MMRGAAGRPVERSTSRGSAVVIGAGLGGLATAARLQHAGWDVVVLEKNETVGGRCGVIRAGGFTIDTGPTLLLMRDVLDELFASVGKALDDYLELVRLNPNYRVHFGDGSCLELSGHLDRVAGQLEGFEPGAGNAFRRYLADARYKYRVSRERFVERNFVRWHDFFTPTNLYYLVRTNALRRLDRHAARYFTDPRLLMAFTFQTMYLGLSPRDAPAIYSLLPYTELEEGIWFPRGGMYRVAEALCHLARDVGARIETGREVERIAVEEGKASGVWLADGSYVPADVVICNADLPYAYTSLVPEAQRGRFTPRRVHHLDHGSSAYLLYLGINRDYPQLTHHNVFLSRDTTDNFDAIFKRFEIPTDPALYLCMPTRTDPTLAPAGHHVLYVLVPAPRLATIDWDVEEQRFRERIYARLAEIGLNDLRRHVVLERVFTPRDFADTYNVMYGSAFGISHTLRQVGYMRPANKAARISNVYFVGASTVPGGGVPMVVLSSRLAAERIAQEQSRG